MGTRSAYPAGWGHRPATWSGASLVSDGTNALMKAGPPVPNGLGAAALTITGRGAVSFLGADPERSRTVIHLEIKNEAARHPGEKVDPFTVAETFRRCVSEGLWINGIAGGRRARDTGYNRKYKSHYVRAMRDTIKAVAARFDLPAVLVAGVVYDRADAEDTVRRSVDFGGGPIAGPVMAGRTSSGSTSLGPRDALAALGYDADSVDPSIRKEVVESLSRDHAFAIYVWAKDLRDTFFATKGAAGLIDGDTSAFGSRTGHGPGPSDESRRIGPGFGPTSPERRAWLERLLSCVPLSQPPG